MQGGFVANVIEQHLDTYSLTDYTITTYLETFFNHSVAFPLMNNLMCGKQRIKRIHGMVEQVKDDVKASVE